jgi:putative methylase
MISAKSLAIALQQLDVFEKADIASEQYPSDPDVAGEILHIAGMLGDIAKKRVLDLGAGTGLLGIGAYLLGASEVVMIERDPKAVKIAKNNMETAKYWVKSESSISIKELDIVEKRDEINKSDVIIMNPPFGTKKKGADSEFLQVAFGLADVIYSFHKTITAGFLREMSTRAGFTVSHEWHFPGFRIRKSHQNHKKKLHTIDVTVFRFVKRA